MALSRGTVMQISFHLAGLSHCSPFPASPGHVQASPRLRQSSTRGSKIPLSNAQSPKTSSVASVPGDKAQDYTAEATAEAPGTESGDATSASTGSAAMAALRELDAELAGLALQEATVRGIGKATGSSAAGDEGSMAGGGETGGRRIVDEQRQAVQIGRFADPSEWPEFDGTFLWYTAATLFGFSLVTNTLYTLLLSVTGPTAPTAVTTATSATSSLLPGSSPTPSSSSSRGDNVARLFKLTASGQSFSDAMSSLSAPPPSSPPPSASELSNP